jgi:sensor domain CHASE-containing protein
MQKVRLWEVTAPQGYQVISGEFTVCYTATGWTEMSNTAGADVVFYADQSGGFVQFFDTPTGTSTQPTVLYPSVSMTGACGTSNDTVLASSSPDYTSGSPVWSGTQVSVMFTMNQGVTSRRRR